MTKLLNRGNLYCIVRTNYDYENTTMTICGGFSELSEADDAKGMFEQQWRDKVGDMRNVEFDIQLTTYYGK